MSPPDKRTKASIPKEAWQSVFGGILVTHKTQRLMLALGLLVTSSCSTARFSLSGESARSQEQRINELQAQTQALQVQVHELESAEAKKREELEELYERLLQVMLKLNIDAPTDDLSENISPTRSRYP